MTWTHLPPVAPPVIKRFAVRRKAGTFNESDHPRADDGRFGSGGGGGSNKPKEKPAEQTNPGTKPAGSKSTQKILGDWKSQEGDSAKYEKTRQEGEKWAKGESSPKWEAMHKETQTRLKEQGFKGGQVYRGVGISEDHPLVQAILAGKIKPGDSIKNSNETVNSWSDNYGTASNFMLGSGGHVQIVFSRDVSPEDIAACHLTQKELADHGENEFIVKNKGEPTLRIEQLIVNGKIYKSFASAIKSEGEPMVFDLSDTDAQRGIAKGKKTDTKHWLYINKSWSESSHPRANDGRFGTGGGTSNPASKPATKPTGTATSTLAKAKAIVAKNSAKLSALADKIPGLGHVKRGMAKTMKGIHGKLEQRYGAKAATTIMTSGALGGYGVAAASFAVTGIPGIPVVNDLISIVGHTMVAEICLQFGKLTGHTKAADLDEKTMTKLVKAAQAEMVKAWADLVGEHGDGIAAGAKENLAAVKELVGSDSVEDE